MSTLQQQTTQLEFHQAMADFKTMFPDMDDEVIEAVLRANQGAVDATIDQLLAMSTDNENEKLRNEMEKKETLNSTNSPKDSISERKNKSPETTTLIDTSTPGSELIPLKTIKGWSPPMLGPLPDDFLRISPSPWGGTHKKQTMMLSQQLLQQKLAEHQRVRGSLGEGTDPDLDRYLEDERFALFLQNEEFMAELRWNKDFLSTLEKDQRPNEDSPPEEAMASFPHGKSLHDEDALFRERLRNMGKVSRKKFAQLARMFTGRHHKRSGGASSGALGGSGHGGSKQLLLGGQMTGSGVGSTTAPTEPLLLDVPDGEDDDDDADPPPSESRRSD